MAEVVNSLFGITPESLMAQREAKAQQEAMSYAQLSDPFARANYQIYKGASGLGSQLAGMFGAQDPEMQRLTQRQTLLQQAQPQDAAGWKGLAQQFYNAGDTPAAQEALAKSQALESTALEARKTESIISKNMAERQAAATPAEIAKANAIAGFKQAIRSLEAGEQTPEVIASLQVYKDRLSALEPVAKAPDFGDKREAIAGELFENKTFAQLTPSQKATVNKRVQEEAKDTTPKYTATTELKMPPDIVQAVGAVDRATEKEVTMLDSAKLAKRLINETAKTNNSQAWEAARTTVAKAVGENKLSNEDIRRTGVDPRLVEGALDWVNKKIKGVPNPDIQKQLYVLGSVLENNAASRYDAKISRYRGAAEAAKFPGKPSTYFPTAAERDGTVAPNAVDWSSLK